LKYTLKILVLKFSEIFFKISVSIGPKVTSLIPIIAFYIVDFRCPYGLGQCCEEKNGTFGCCPFVEAVCCSDSHCCPKGTTCDVEKGECIGQALSIPFHWMLDLSDPEVYSAGVFKPQKLRKQLPGNKVAEVKNEVKGIEESSKIDEDMLCPDASHCGSNNTCCMTNPLKYGCCPYAQGEFPKLEEEFCDHCGKYAHKCCRGPEGEKFCCPFSTKCSDNIPFICFPDFQIFM
ncbi:Granulin, partial [Armadillidium vulgare]